MSNKKRKVKTRESQSPWLETHGLHAVVPGSAPSQEVLDGMTRRYQQEIRNSSLWDEMVREFGEEEAEQILREFRVEIR
jgi:hypothetical protein